MKSGTSAGVNISLRDHFSNFLPNLFLRVLFLISPLFYSYTTSKVAFASLLHHGTPPLCFHPRCCFRPGAPSSGPLRHRNRQHRRQHRRRYRQHRNGENNGQHERERQLAQTKTPQASRRSCLHPRVPPGVSGARAQRLREHRQRQWSDCFPTRHALSPDIVDRFLQPLDGGFCQRRLFVLQPCSRCLRYRACPGRVHV